MNRLKRLLTTALAVLAVLLWGIGLAAFAGRVPAGYGFWCLVPAAAGAVVLLLLLVHVRRQGEPARRCFAGLLATTLLLVLACAWADLFLVNGRIFLGLLEHLRLSIFLDDRAVLTLAVATGLVHPLLLAVSGLGLLCLPAASRPAR